MVSEYYWCNDHLNRSVICYNEMILEPSVDFFEVSISAVSVIEALYPFFLFVLSCYMLNLVFFWKNWYRFFSSMNEIWLIRLITRNTEFVLKRSSHLEFYKTIKVNAVMHVNNLTRYYYLLVFHISLSQLSQNLFDTRIIYAQETKVNHWSFLSKFGWAKEMQQLIGEN